MTITASATDRDLVARPQSPYRAAPFAEGRVYSVRPRPSFALDIARGDGVWTVVDRGSGIYGAGDSPSEALGDFRSAAREHLDVLERQDSLSDDLAAQLAYLRERLDPH